ncbi:MAG: hypothetical protein O3A30_03865 [Bacteroidetes bacterium]|nr:hypothetical protein [Bacteroidota bacterium]
MTNAVPNQVYVYQDSPNQVIVEDSAPTVIEVIAGGGGAVNTRRHVHVQSSPSSAWTITHTLGGKPSVMVVDSADSVVVGDVIYVSTTEIRVEFTAPFSGYAYLT